MNAAYLPNSLKSSCLVATGALNIDRPSLFLVPSLAPDLTMALHMLALPSKYANNNTANTQQFQ